MLDIPPHSLGWVRRLGRNSPPENIFCLNQFQWLDTFPLSLQKRSASRTYKACSGAGGPIGGFGSQHSQVREPSTPLPCLSLRRIVICGTKLARLVFWYPHPRKLSLLKRHGYQRTLVATGVWLCVFLCFVSSTKQFHFLYDDRNV